MTKVTGHVESRHSVESGQVDLKEAILRQSVFAASWRYRYLVAAVVLATTLLALIYSYARPPAVVAVASVVLAQENNENFGLIESGSTERRVANELEILQSAAVADQAAELSRSQGVEVTIGDVLERVSVTNIRNTDVITLSVQGDDVRSAEVLAQATLDAYQDVRLTQRRTNVARVVELLDTAEEVLTGDLATVNANISALRATRDLSSQIDIALDQLTEVSRILNDPATTEDEADELRVSQDRLVAHLSALRIAFETEADNPELRRLLTQQEVLSVQLTELSGRRSDVTIETEAAGTGISFVSPPTVTETVTGGGGPFIR